MTKTEQKGFDIRAAFKRGKENENVVVRLATRITEGLWNTGIVLGSGLSKAEEPTKRKRGN
jgi:hypothetical protein